MSAPKMGVEDLKRLLLEMDPEEVEEWMEKQGIDPEMLSFFAEKLSKAFLYAVMIDDQDARQSAFSLVCSSFQVGWEASRQYGGGLSERP